MSEAAVHFWRNGGEAQPIRMVKIQTNGCKCMQIHAIMHEMRPCVPSLLQHVWNLLYLYVPGSSSYTRKHVFIYSSRNKNSPMIRRPKRL